MDDLDYKMSKFTVELDYDAVDSIVVQVLKEQLDAFETVLSYNMTHDDFEKWKNENL